MTRVENFNKLKAQMKTWMVVLTGVVAVAVVSYGVGKQRGEIKAMHEMTSAEIADIASGTNKPSAGDDRIVDNHDGTYSIQTYHSQPMWVEIPNSRRGSLAECQYLFNILNHPSPTPVKPLLLIGLERTNGAFRVKEVFNGSPTGYSNLTIKVESKP